MSLGGYQMNVGYTIRDLLMERDGVNNELQSLRAVRKSLERNIKNTGDLRARDNYAIVTQRISVLQRQERDISRKIKKLTGMQ